MKLLISVTLKEDVLDPQGLAIKIHFHQLVLIISIQLARKNN